MPSIREEIFDKVMEAMQEAEEMGGPENFEYTLLTGEIIKECSERLITYSEATL